MKLSAFDALGRGLANVRANWELVFLRFLGIFGVGLVVLAGLLPPLLVLGFGLLRESYQGLTTRPPDVEAWTRFASRIGDRLPAVLPAFALALVGTLAVWLFACVAYCFLEAGIFGVLVAAERQALPGAGRKEWFRTFSLGHFLGWGGRYMWRFFGFAGLWGAAWIGVLLAWIFWAFLLAAGGKRWGQGATIGIGCGGFLPLLFLVLVVTLWGAVAMADLAREGSSVWGAASTGLRVLGARFGAVLLLALLFFVCVLLLAFLFFVCGLLLGLILANAPFGVGFGLRFALQIAQSLAGSFLALVLAASLVALVQSEVSRLRPSKAVAA